MFSDPYRTVLINVISSIVLFIGVVFYKLVYPKREISFFKILILISILPLLSLLRPGDYESGDFNIHIYRIMSFYDSLREGNLMPSWAGELNATYGNPLFIFNYSFPYYFVSLLHMIGLSFISAMKIYLGVSLFFSGIFMYIFIKELTKNKLAAFSSAIFYLFNPYHLIDVHFRATLGESTIFTFAPIVFYILLRYINTKKRLFLIFLAILIGVLFQAHPLMAISILGIMFLFSIYQVAIKNEKRLLIPISLTLIIGGLSSIYLWSSFIIYAPVMYPYPTSDLYFYPFIHLFFSPWMFGLLFQGHFGELALIIGYTQLIIIAIVVAGFFTNKISQKYKIHFAFWAIFFFLFLLLMHPSSFFIWKLFPIFWMFPPTGRLSLPIAFITSVLAGYFILNFLNTKSRRKIAYLIIALTIFYTILNWGHRTVLSGINDQVLREKVWASTLAEGRVAYFLNNKWADHDNFWFSEVPKENLEIIKGEGLVTSIFRNSTRHVYLVNAKTHIKIKENTLYYPGWKMESNGKEIKIYPGERGVINANLSSGLQKVELKYEDILIYKTLKLLSVFIFLSLIILLIFLLPYPKHFPRNPKIPNFLKRKKGPNKKH